MQERGHDFVPANAALIGRPGAGGEMAGKKVLLDMFS
jgi:hypothetical protein